MATLFECVNTGDFPRLIELLMEGNSPNIQNENGDTPLHLAAFQVQGNQLLNEDNLRVARMLINFRADVNLANNLGNTPLHLAAARWNYEIIGILLNSGAKLDVADSNGNTVLHYAIHKCTLLSRADSQYICPGDDSCTDLLAVQQILRHHLSFFLINMVNNLAETPLMWAVKVGHLRIVQELSQKGAKQNLRDLYNLSTALHFAVDQPVVNIHIVDELLKHGSYPCMKNIRFLSAVDVYLRRLLDAPHSEKIKATYLFKRFLLRRNFLTDHQLLLINRNHLDNIFFVRSELYRMRRRKITSRISVYNAIAKAYGKNEELPLEHCDYIFDKLMIGKYKMYSFIITSLFPRTYLCHKFALICCWQVIDNVRQPFLNYDLRFHLAFLTLSHFDMYNMLIAGSE